MGLDLICSRLISKQLATRATGNDAGCPFISKGDLMSKPKPMPEYWELYQEVTHLHGYLDKLKAENDKLKMERDYWHTEQARASYAWSKAFKRSYMSKHEITTLKDENKKLRALVRGLDYCSDELNSAECDRCPLHDPSDPNFEPKCVRMMRDLGIDKEKYNV